ncbi:MAG: acylphosphatase [Myxococcales bacterium]|nr:acylphosphatase [Myxococcales bacterium]
MALKQIHIRVTGRVQGVFFRASTARRARELGLSGWVRNRADGSVEAVFAGPAAIVERMIAWCHDGPPLAAVDEVVCVPADEPDAGEGGFRQLPTA